MENLSESLEELSALKNLKLEFSGCKIENEAFVDLGIGLKKLKNLQDVNFIFQQYQMERVIIYNF